MSKPIISQIFSGYMRWRYPEGDAFQKELIKHQFIAGGNQLKFLLKDYVFRPNYKQIVFQGEFQQELINVLPFAYWHYCNGTLRRTVAAKKTRQFFYFSPDHHECFDNRAPQFNFNRAIPNSPHTFHLNTRKWKPVPFKKAFANRLFVFDKPMLVIANRYTHEWEGPPVSFFDIPTLDFLFSTFKDHYQIVYNRPRPEFIIADNSPWLDLHEFPWIRATYPQVILMEDLFKQHRNEVTDYNHLQLMVYANCERFISVHGGTATLASCFGGINVILSKKGREHEFGEFKNVFPLLSGAKILHAKNKEQLKSLIKSWL